MAAARHNESGLPPATAPGVAALSAVITALARALHDVIPASLLITCAVTENGIVRL